MFIHIGKYYMNKANEKQRMICHPVSEHARPQWNQIQCSWNMTAYPESFLPNVPPAIGSYRERHSLTI